MGGPWRALSKRRHRGQRIHVVAPTHDLPIYDRDNRYETVFVELAGTDRVALNLIFEHDDAGSLGKVHYKRACAMQRDILPVSCVKSHERFTPHDFCWVVREPIAKLEHRMGSDRVEIVITVDKP